MTNPSLNDLEEEYNEIAQIHSQVLKRQGVVMPGMDSKLAVMLIYLRRNMGKLVSIKSLTEFVSAYFPDSSKDNQPRHLKYKGWNISLSGKSPGIPPI